jgi:hypothetical protein
VDANSHAARLPQTRESRKRAAAGMCFNSAPKELSDTTVCVYGRDPDGNVLELIELKDPADPIAVA